MARAHQFEYPTVGYDAMVVGRGGVMGTVVETVACWSFEKPYDVPDFDVRRPAPGYKDRSCPRHKVHETEAWKPSRPCPRCGEGTIERVPLAATVD